MKNFIRFSDNTEEKGFTLSEVMIVLAIIGIVSAFTLGTVLGEINKNQTIVRLQKFYSVLSEALNREAVHSGRPEYWDVPESLSEKASYDVFKKYLRNNLAIMKDCNGDTDISCNFVFKELDGTEKTLNATWTKFYLNDGMFVAMQYIGEKNYKVMYFYVDTNGKKRLNVVARDIFLFEYWLQNEENPEYVGIVYPLGHEYTREEITSTSDEYNCNKHKNGNYCAALIMKDGWQLKEGYPWAQARFAVK